MTQNDYANACESVYNDDSFTRIIIDCAESVVDDSGSTVEALTQARDEMIEFLTVSDAIPSGETRLVLVDRARKIRDTADIRAELKALETL